MASVPPLCTNFDRYWDMETQSKPMRRKWTPAKRWLSPAGDAMADGPRDQEVFGSEELGFEDCACVGQFEES